MNGRKLGGNHSSWFWLIRRLIDILLGADLVREKIRSHQFEENLIWFYIGTENYVEFCSETVGSFKYALLLISYLFFFAQIKNSLLFCKWVTSELNASLWRHIIISILSFVALTPTYRLHLWTPFTLVILILLVLTLKGTLAYSGSRDCISRIKRPWNAKSMYSCVGTGWR